MNEQHTPFEELAQDEPLVILLNRIREYVDAHKKQVGIAIAAVLILVVGGTAAVSIRKANESAASTELTQILNANATGEMDAEASLEKLVALAASRKGSVSGDLAAIHAARMAVEAGKFDIAVSHFESVLSSRSGFSFEKGMLLLELGVALEKNGNLEAARDRFKAAGEAKMPGYVREQGLYNEGRVEALLGNWDASKSAHAALLAAFPNTGYAELVRTK